MSTLADRIAAVLLYVDGERTPITGTPLSFMLDDLARLSTHNPNWPPGTRMQWQDAVTAAIAFGQLIEAAGMVRLSRKEPIDKPKQGELF